MGTGVNAPSLGCLSLCCAAPGRGLYCPVGLVSQALSWQNPIRLEGLESFPPVQSQVGWSIWRPFIGPMSMVGTRPKYSFSQHCTRGLGFSGIFWGKGQLYFLWALPWFFSLPTPYTQGLWERYTTSPSFTDEEWALCEWADPSCPVCMLSATREVSQTPSHQAAEGKKWSLTRKWGIGEEIMLFRRQGRML